MNLLMCFLLLCVGLDPSWGVLSPALVVSQSANVSVLEGKTVNITCCWTDAASRVGLKWLKDQTIIRNKTVMSQTEGYWNKHKNKCENLTLENIKRTDSGRYICKVSVEIPVLSEAEGNGTTITVTPIENPADSGDRQTRNEEKKKTDKVGEDKGDDNSKPHVVDKGKEKAVIHKEKTPDRPITRIAEDSNQELMFTFILRSLPILSLITAFFWLYYIGTRAQKEKAAASSQQHTEENKKGIVTKEAKGKRTRTTDHHVHPVRDVD